MRQPGAWTDARYRLLRVARRIACWWAWVVAGFEELAILVGFIPRHRPPSRHPDKAKKP